MFLCKCVGGPEVGLLRQSPEYKDSETRGYTRGRRRVSGTPTSLFLKEKEKER